MKTKPQLKTTNILFKDKLVSRCNSFTLSAIQIHTIVRGRNRRIGLDRRQPALNIKLIMINKQDLNIKSIINLNRNMEHQINEEEEEEEEEEFDKEKRWSS